MKKIKIFIDYPVSADKKFKGLSFPQVLHDYLITRDDVEVVGENDKFDILLVINGGSHYAHKNYSVIDIIKIKLGMKVNGLIHEKQSAAFNRFLSRNIFYEKRLSKLIKNNPNAKVIQRLDDRYKILCKVYGFEKTLIKICEMADAVIFQTKYGESLFTKGVKTIFGFLGPCKFKKGKIIHNGVDRDVFQENGNSFKFSGKFNILHVATTGMTRKGLGTVLEFANILKDNKDIQFYLIGNQNRDPIYGRMINKFSNVHKIAFTDDRYKLAEYYRGGDMLLFPTINDCSPNVVLEAMSCGIPVLAADSGGTPELIIKDDVQGGLLINENNPIYNFKEILNNLESFKKNAVELVKKYHTKEKMGEEYLNFFKSLLD